MSEFKSTLTGKERKARIRDIRERKGHLLGLINPKDSGYVPGVMPNRERMKYSVPIRPTYLDDKGNYYTLGSEEVAYIFKGVPPTSIRPGSPNVSEYA